MGAPNQQDAQDIFSRADTQTIKRRVITGATTLTIADSGALCVWNTAAGYTFTLPAITANGIGTWFDFYCAITNTSVVAKILAVGTDYIIGNVISITDAATPSATVGPKAFPFNGSSHLACNFGGSDTTSGGLAGTSVRLVMLPSLKWGISGTVHAAGTIVTPAATS